MHIQTQTKTHLIAHTQVHVHANAPYNIHKLQYEDREKKKRHKLHKHTRALDDHKT